MNIMRACFAAIALTALTSGTSHASGLTAVRPLPGYQCLQLKVLPSDPRQDVPPTSIYENPSASARTIGIASSIVFVRTPLVRQNGFVWMMMPNKVLGWISSDAVEPYHSPYFPNSKCIPSVMSNDSIGETFSR